MYLHWLCVPTLVMFLGADDAPKDLAKLQGTWSIVSAERSGEKLPEEPAKKMRVVIKENTLTVQEGEGPKAGGEKAAFKVNPATKPKSLDITPAKRDGSKIEKKTVLGIYELDGDTLKLCWRKEGGERPAKFATEPKSGLVLFVLKRQSKQ